MPGNTTSPSYRGPSSLTGRSTSSTASASSFARVRANNTATLRNCSPRKPSPLAVSCFSRCKSAGRSRTATAFSSRCSAHSPPSTRPTTKRPRCTSSSPLLLAASTGRNCRRACARCGLPGACSSAPRCSPPTSITSSTFRPRYSPVPSFSGHCRGKVPRRCGRTRP